MTASRTLATADDIHAHLVEQLNHALRRPGMFGGETALWLLFDHLLFAEGQPTAWDEERGRLAERGCWNALGVQGVFQRLIPGRNHEYGVASVYAEFAHRRGWLRPDRVLDAETYDALVARARQWAGEDRWWSEVVAEFGEPSVLFGGNNPLYGKTLGYLTEDPGRPIVFFHLWNGSLDGTEPSWPPAHEEPLLFAVRFGDGPFPETFTFTPAGLRLRPAPEAAPCAQSRPAP
ncbi:hypothetical protein [Streptomyces dysideae]|uniref:Uncharacterized protein n=1 Tax=Streptomyces dysideae TaxID=909626 RepID=A0A124ID95_9ACTN|nr:hypothetical protein [Streptomyces dysideae]KUO14435.1 hypothetical protein AQJ91_46755 [Streptomyces dysideae]